MGKESHCGMWLCTAMYLNGCATLMNTCDAHHLLDDDMPGLGNAE